jgi:O-6-methylguanine DNA methyltransferase
MSSLPGAIADDLLADELARLRVTAPPSVTRRARIALGLGDAYSQVESPIGPLFVVFNGLGNAGVALAGDPVAFERERWAETHRQAWPVEHLPRRLAAAVGRRIAGDRRIGLRLDLRGRTEFERAVWSKALQIPRGELRPYGWIAAEIGRPRAVRAVGTALGRNPVPLLVPCHRVVRSDGLIGEYSLGGATSKRTMLRSEGLDPDACESLAQAGVRFIGSDTTGIYCLPTCRHARRITDRHRVALRSSADGEQRGFRACRDCRPVSGTA